MKSVYPIVLFLFPLFTKAQIIDIPDPNFKNALVNTLCVDSNGDGILDTDADADNDGEIDTSEAEAILVLNVSSQSISSLEGIESFINLELLNCSVNSIDNLNLSQNVGLTALICFSNNLTNLDTNQNISLQALTCYNNNLISLDISQSTSIKNLDFGGNELTSLDLSKNINLEVIYGAFNKLESLDLSLNPNLLVVLCNQNHLVSLNLKNGNTENISHLDVTNNLDLRCIIVDDVDYANGQECSPDLWCKDDTAYYIEECDLNIPEVDQTSFTLYPNPAQSTKYTTY